METDSVPFLALNLAISVAVPFATVWLTHCLIRKDSKRQRASDIFANIERHTLELRMAILSFWRATMEGPLPSLAEDDFKREKQERQKWKQLVAREYFAIHTAMNADIRQLRFLFSDKATPLTSILHNMMTMHEAFDLEQVPAAEEFDKRASELTHEAADEINMLWDSLA